MRISIKVIANASKSEIISHRDGAWKVKIQAPPKDGKANRALIQLLAQHFQLPKNCIKIIAGEKSPQKMIEVFNLPNKNTLNQ
ncbi:MAG: DUF167 domain-containing protein [Puniceicoccales bacterium]|jgi:uncharacterized protein (TIGR00251 family)|nr:DUF167 domain-containing protein [Puniceicoccales bacterium]